MAQVLEQASIVTATPEGPYEMYDYVVSLREGIMDAWGGIIGAMKASSKSKFIDLQPNDFVLMIVQLKPCSHTCLPCSSSLALLPTT